MNRRQFRIKHDGFQTRYALLCFISNYGDSRHGNIMADREGLGESGCSSSVCEVFVFFSVVLFPFDA